MQSGQDSNQRFKLTATGIDGISIHWYVSILVAGEGLEPPSSAYETELETTSSLTRYVVVIKGLEPLTGELPKPAHETSRCTCITIFVVWEWNRTIGTRGFNPLL